MLIKERDYCTAMPWTVIIKSHSKMHSCILQQNTTNATGLKEQAICMLTAGMFTRAVVCELNVHFISGS